MAQKIVPISESIEKYLHLKRENVSLLRFILEGYEGFATATTIDKNRAIVKLFVMPDFVDELNALLASLNAELDMTEIPDSPDDMNGGRRS